MTLWNHWASAMEGIIITMRRMIACTPRNLGHTKEQAHLIIEASNACNADLPSGQTKVCIYQICFKLLEYKSIHITAQNHQNCLIIHITNSFYTGVRNMSFLNIQPVGL